MSGSLAHGFVVMLVGVALIWPGCSKEPDPVATSSVREAPQVDLDLLDPPQAAALREAREQVLKAPQSGEAWGRFGQHLHAIDYHQEAIVCYGKAGELDRRSARWPYLQGLLLLQNDPEAGLFQLGRAVQLADVTPENPRLHLAQALMERGQLAEARPHLQRLLEQLPNHPAAALEMGRWQLLQSDLERSAQTLTICLTNQFTRRPALLLLAQVRQRQGQHDQAAALARQAANLPEPFDWPDPYLREVMRFRVDRQKLQDQINGLLMGGRMADAETGLKNLLGAFPDDAEGLLLLGRLRFLQRRCDAAEEALRRHLAVRADSLNGLVQLGLAILCQERWDDGATVLRRALALKPDFAEAHYNLGYALTRAGDLAGARQSYAEALRCRPGYVDAHVALAESWWRAQDSAQAQYHLQRALDLDPQNQKAQRLRTLLVPQP